MTRKSPGGIGPRGPLGRGCSPAAKILASRRGYKPFLLSSIITEHWKQDNPKRVPSRADLQALGNEIRQQSGNPGALEEIAIGKLEQDTKEWNLILIDGIRNVGEIEVLRDRFGRRFYLLAMECPTSERWRRLRSSYAKGGLAIEDFLRDNERDRLQEYAHGQQVQ